MKKWYNATWHGIGAMCLISISGCSYKKVVPDRQICFVEKHVQDIISQPVRWCRASYGDKRSESVLNRSLTPEQAIGLALQNSPTLQAKCNELGIAKADLTKAGLFSNPQLNTIIQFPKPNLLNADNYVEVDLAWNISDLWLVPCRKKISQDQLEIATFDIIDTILDIRMNTQTAYNKCVYAAVHLHGTQGTLASVRAAYEDPLRTDGRKEKHSVLDEHARQTLFSQLEIAVATAEFDYKSALYELKGWLGMPPTNEPLVLSNQFDSINPNVLVYDIAPDNPKLMKAQLKIQQEKHKKSLEKRRFLSDVHIGLSYNNQPVKNAVTVGSAAIQGAVAAGPRLLGPTLALSIPIFDNQYADVSRAEFLVQKAENDYANVVDALALKVAQCRAEIESICSIIDNYKNIILSYERIILYEQEHPDVVDVKRFFGLHTHMEFFDKKNALLKVELQLSNVLAVLEQTIGRKIN